MTLRPHCLQCGSASVVPDEDVRNGRKSVYCAVCGNRQYRDTDYVGFEMREGAKKETCKNSDLPMMVIPPLTPAPAMKPIVEKDRFSNADILLFQTFQDHIRRMRRDPAGQIIFQWVEKALGEELGV